MTVIIHPHLYFSDSRVFLAATRAVCASVGGAHVYVFKAPKSRGDRDKILTISVVSVEYLISKLAAHTYSNFKIWKIGFKLVQE